MDDKILVQCSDFDTVAILKAAIVNATARLERCSSRRERQELRRFILDCAREIEGLLRACKPLNIKQGPTVEEYNLPNGETITRTSYV